MVAFSMAIDYSHGCIANKKGVGTHPKIAILKQLQSYFKAKRGKGVRTLFPRVPAPLHP